MSRVEQAFKAVKRSDFLPRARRFTSFFDAPISIGYGQTNSQPTTVRMMLEWLDPRPGDKVLDVGSGSGWTTALLAHLVGNKGSVFAVEKVPELVTFGKQNCGRAGIRNVSFYEAGNSLGLPSKAPFDRILVSAAAKQLPQPLINQLKVGGRLVAPVSHSIFVVDKTSSAHYDLQEHYGFSFVPLVS